MKERDEDVMRSKSERASSCVELIAVSVEATAWLPTLWWSVVLVCMRGVQCYQNYTYFTFESYSDKPSGSFVAVCGIF